MRKEHERVNLTIPLNTQKYIKMSKVAPQQVSWAGRHYTEHKKQNSHCSITVKLDSRDPQDLPEIAWNF